MTQNPSFMTGLENDIRGFLGMGPATPMTSQQAMGMGYNMQALGSMMSGAMGYGAGMGNASVARMTASMNADEILRQAAEDADRAYRAGEISLGATRAAYGASGVRLGGVTPQNVINAEVLGIEKVVTDIEQRGRRAADMEMFTGEARALAYESQAEASLLSGIVGGTSSLLMGSVYG